MPASAPLPPASTPPPGTAAGLGVTLADRYQLEAEIGRGGMGVIYRARDLLLDRAVAVKLLNDAGLGEAGRERLLREARAAARLNHPSIVAVYDAGEARLAGDAPSAFIVMELVVGQSLYERWPLPLEAVLSVAGQVCAALGHAHAHGLIHRDLKPENVLLAADGRVKLTDFGLARSAAVPRTTPDGPLVGTPFYLAPEQALGQTIDGRADLYALGVLLYELVTGRLPFTGDDPLLIIAQHVHAPVTAPSVHRPDLPAALEAVILRLLAKAPDDRYPTAEAVAQALAGLADDHAPRPGTRLRHNLPLQLTRFIGREREITTVREQLAAHRLVTLVGPGGSGKTRLALQLAAELERDQAAFPDGLWLVELAPITNAALLTQTVAALLGVRDEPSHPLLPSLVEHLRGRALLLILDNCEHLVEACAQFVETVLRSCPRVAVLATSREALGIPGEAPQRLPSLAAPDPNRLPPLETLAQIESVRLLVDRISVVQPAFTLTDANAGAVAQICHRLDGLPLALELAAARARAMTVEQIAARLDDRFRLLTGGSRTALPRQQTLRALIDWSWDLLTEPERTLLRRLTVFASGWTLEAAEKVCAWSVDPDAWPGPASLSTPAEALDLLTHLVDKSLVLVEDQPGQPRYRLLDTIRQYAREKLLNADEAASVRDRHLAHSLKLAEKAEPELRRPTQIAWLERLDLEHDNLRAALQWALESDALERGLRLAGALSRFWYLRGYWAEGRAWLQAFLERSPQPGTDALRRARALALAGAGWLADEDGSEVPLYVEGLALFQQLDDRWGAAFCLRGLGAGAIFRGDVDGGQTRLAESLALFEALTDPWGIGAAAYNLGWLDFNRDDVAAASVWWERGLTHFRRSGDRWGIAVTLGSLGYLARLRGDYTAAMALAEESLALFRELGDQAGIATSLIRLGNVAFRRGEYRQALELIEESLALDRERGDRSSLISSLSLLGLVATYRGEFERATQFLTEAVAIGRELSDPYELPYAIAYTGLLAYYRGDLDAAQAAWEESLTWQRRSEDRGGIGYTLNGLGRVAFRRGDLARARALLEAALVEYREVGDRRYIGAGLHDLGLVCLAAGDQGQACDHLSEALAVRKKIGDKQGLAETLEAVAALHPDEPRPAAQLLGAAQALREAIGLPVPPVERADLEKLRASLPAALGAAGYAAASAAGRAQTLEQTIAEAKAVLRAARTVSA